MELTPPILADKYFLELKRELSITGRLKVSTTWIASKYNCSKITANIVLRKLLDYLNEKKDEYVMYKVKNTYFIRKRNSNIKNPDFIKGLIVAFSLFYLFNKDTIAPIEFLKANGIEVDLSELKLDEKDILELIYSIESKNEPK